MYDSGDRSKFNKLRIIYIILLIKKLFRVAANDTTICLGIAACHQIHLVFVYFISISAGGLYGPSPHAYKWCCLHIKAHMLEKNHTKKTTTMERIYKILLLCPYDCMMYEFVYVCIVKNCVSEIVYSLVYETNVRKSIKPYGP